MLCCTSLYRAAAVTLLLSTIARSCMCLETVGSQVFWTYSIAWHGTGYGYRASEAAPWRLNSPPLHRVLLGGAWQHIVALSTTRHAELKNISFCAKTKRVMRSSCHDTTRNRRILTSASAQTHAAGCQRVLKLKRFTTLQSANMG